MPNLHLAVEGYVAASGRSGDLHGVTSEMDHFEVDLAKLSAPSVGYLSRSLTLGPVMYANVALAEGKTLACVRTALRLVHDRGQPLVIFQAHSASSYRRRLSLEVMAADRASAEAVLAEIRTSMRRNSVYRGHVVSLGLTGDSSLDVSFHHVPSIRREDVILPPSVLERVERQAFAFTRHRESLLRAGRHLKRGMLLHGPPGTGKTFTAMYLAAQMKDRTVLLVTGRQQGLIGPVCTMARLLEPSTVILEDVDLIALDRRHEQAACGPLLFELLNEMDGLRADADVFFILTTNRPEALEPALAARPGRVDLAVEVPLPDPDCRRRLIETYGRGLNLALSEPGKWAARTEGVSGAFIKELLRRAALFAADDGADAVIDRHVDDALRELLADRDRLTRTLLGATEARTAGT